MLRFHVYSSVASAAATRSPVPSATPVANPSLLKASPPPPRAGIPAATPVPTTALSQNAAVASSVTAQPKKDDSFDEFDEFSDVPGHIPGPVASSAQSKAAAMPIKAPGKTTAHLSPKSGVVIHLLLLLPLLLLPLLYV